jgi:hypothetical protein
MAYCATLEASEEATSAGRGNAWPTGGLGSCGAMQWGSCASPRCHSLHFLLASIAPAAAISMHDAVLCASVSKCSFGTVCFGLLGVAAASACHILGVDGEGGGFMHSACRCQLSAATWSGLVGPTPNMGVCAGVVHAAHTALCASSMWWLAATGVWGLVHAQQLESAYHMVPPAVHQQHGMGEGGGGG